MKTLRLLWLAVMMTLAAACSKDSTGPKKSAGLDPTVSFTNVSPYVVAMDWYSQSGLSSHTMIGSGDSTCIIFLSAGPVDSVRYVIDDSTYRPSNVSGQSKQWSPWFDPTTGIVLNGVLASGDHPTGLEYWVIVWGGHVGPKYGADSVKYAVIVDAPPCK